MALSKRFSRTTISSVVSSLCFNFEEFAIRLFYMVAQLDVVILTLAHVKKQSKNSLLAKKNIHSLIIIDVDS